MQNLTLHCAPNQAKTHATLASILALSLRAARQTHTVADLRTFRRAVRFRKNDLDGKAGLGGFSRSEFIDLCAIRPSAPESAPLVTETPHLSSPVSTSSSTSSSSSSSSSTSSASPTQTHVNQIKQLIRDARAHYGYASTARAKKLATDQRNREEAEAKAEKRRHGCWRRLDDLDRARAYAATMISTGRAVAFTVNIGPDVLQRAGKAEQGVFDHVRRRITLELTKALGATPSLTCALDVTSTGRLHIHGMLNSDRQQAEIVVAALRRAGGAWASKRGAEHQVFLDAGHWQFSGGFFDDLDRRLTPDWGSYCAKKFMRLKALTKHSILYATKDVKAAAQDIYGSQIKTKATERSINTDLTEQFIVEYPLASESQISFSAGVNTTGRDSNHEDADRIARILREPLGGHARHGCLSRPAPHLDRRAPALGATRLHPARRHDGRRRAHAPRSRRALHPAPQRADTGRARGSGGPDPGVTSTRPALANPQLLGICALHNVCL